MYRSRLICGAVIFALFVPCIDSQTGVAGDQSLASFHLRVAVDEVSLTFHAADSQGLPVSDLKLDELKILDNGKTPSRILAFQSLQNLPIHAGILMDMSESTYETRSADRAIAIQYVKQLLRQETDRAFVINFEKLSMVAQSWTNDPFELVVGIRNLGSSRGSKLLHGTAILDTIYETCLNQFGHLDKMASGNFILLFTDGEDNASRILLKEAIDTCQSANTAVYVFRPRLTPGDASGVKMLTELTSETGGRLFFDDDSEMAIDGNLRAIEANLRSQYRVIYKPQEIKSDGSFHRIEVKTPPRVESVTIRSGYYSPMPR